jgi:hypothetical protein
MDGESEKTHLLQGLEALGLPTDAINWLMDVYRVIQVLDDAADGDKVNRNHIEDAAMAIFVRLPINSFFQEKAAGLIPTLALCVIKWSHANDAEEGGWADERSFMWRAGFYDLVATVCILCGQPASARLALDLYGESFADYRREFPCQRQQ